MVDRGSQQEMHIDLNTASFGSVEVHTTIHGGEVNLAVGSERGDLRSFLTAEVPALQASFQQHDLRFDNIRFLTQHTGNAGTNTGFSGGSGSHSRSFRHANPAQPVIAAAPEERGEVEMMGQTAGLSVHA
jgi:flagellar hook-length control protein FliK